MANSVPMIPNLEVPKGNWIARNLRLVNEDSKQLFPSSACASRGSKKDKFSTLYKVDFKDYPEGDYIEGLKQKAVQPKRQTIRDVLFGNSPSEIFQDWKIPNRVVPEIEASPREAGALAAVLSGKRERQGATPKAVSALPIHRSPRQSKLLSSPPPAAPELGSRRHTTIDGSEIRSELGTRDRLRNNLQPHTVNLANDWLKQAPGADRKVIERLLRMQEKQHQLENAMRKSLQPDAKKSVDDWLETATESERQVALRFFTSVAGAKLMGSTQQEQKGRLQSVIRSLKAQKGQPATPGAAGMRRSLDSGKDSSLQYVRLLDDKTRNQRWMHTTWHHLPEYKIDNPVANKSSHYVMPHAPTPRHFVIHPDWG